MDPMLSSQHSIVIEVKEKLGKKFDESVNDLLKNTITYLIYVVHFI